MVYHYIIMSSSYSNGYRIAYDYVCENEQYNIDKISKIEKEISDIVGDSIPTSKHIVQTENNKWESVVEYDPYFKDVKLIKDHIEFAKIIAKDRTLNGLDVAKYILTKKQCTHLKLEKLVYLCYAEYLVDTKKKMFIDRIKAYKYGPVVKSVYEQYKHKYGDLKDENTTDIESLKDIELAVQSRILFAKDGLEIQTSIEKTLDKYGEKTASQLVDITHRDGSPWSKAVKKSFMGIAVDITDEEIMENHIVETEA